MDVNDQTAIARYVFEFGEHDDVTHASTFRLGLRDARKLAGRDVDTGTVLAPPIASWPAALLYLIVLEQVGKVIRPAPGGAATSADLRSALRDFAPTVSPRDLDTLYGLRNAFAHEYALTNRGRKLGQTDPLRHSFTLVESKESLLINYNEPAWNGEFGDDWVGGATEVNLTQLYEVAEGVVSTIEAMCNDGKLVLIEEVTPDMVLKRWGCMSW